MSREIPEVVRAAAGLAATVLDEARKLPQTLPGLPVRLIGLAMQQSMKVQQHYAGLVARGDELFTGFRGADEPGLATFDDDPDEPVTAPTGYRESAFDRAGDTEPTSDGPDLIIDEEADDLVAAAAEDIAATAPDTEEILDEIAIDELVDQAPTLEETAPAATRSAKAAVTTAAKPAPAPKPAEAAPAPAPPATASPAPATPEAAPTPEAPATTETASGNNGAGTPAVGAAPVDGYDSFTVAQLRGRMRGYALSTVQELVSYEAATRARGPYLTMLRNRLEKLEEQAVESSPLAPRGA